MNLPDMSPGISDGRKCFTTIGTIDGAFRVHMKRRLNLRLIQVGPGGHKTLSLTSEDGWDEHDEHGQCEL